MLLIALVLSACGLRKTEVYDGYSHLRELPVIKPKYSEELTVEYKLYAASATAGQCFVKIDPADLLNKRDSLDQWSRNVSMQLLVKKNPLSKEIIFQSEKSWSFQGETAFMDSFRFELPKSEDVWLEVTYSDLNKHTYFQEQRWWIRKKQLQQQHFALLDSVGKTPLINAWCRCDTLKMQSAYFNDTTLEFLRYDHFDRPALSPFAFGWAEPNLKEPDSAFKAAFTNNRMDIPLKSGFLLIKRPRYFDQLAGFFTYSGDLQASAYECMAYICTAQEMEQMKDTAQMKVVFEQFWVKAAGKDKAKEESLKKEFLRRVEYANQQFSSYKLGSLTDRGMIYIVYGEPERILKEGFQEVWSYKSSGIDHTNFVFLYDQNEIAPNNCYLERSPHYKSTYYIAVEGWRNGMIR